MFDIKAHLKSLVEVHAPSGHEGPVREVLRGAWADLVNEFDQDRLGSLIGIRHATNPPATRRRIMLAAHMDEIGFIVREVQDGFIFVQRLAGIDPRVMLAQPVLVHGRRALPGLVATAPPHLLTEEERRQYPGVEALVIDVGLPADEVARLVRVGDVITPDVPMIELASGLVAAKACDDRACVAAVTYALHLLQTMTHQWDVYAVATVQEESGLIGATTSAHYINPDIAVALDVTFAEQSGVAPDDASEIGGGPVITLGANIHPGMYTKLVAVAQALEMKHQHDPAPGATGTDAWAIQIAQAGIPTALLNIPLRNMHSPVETVDIRDIERTGRLLAHFIASLDADFLSAIDWRDLQTTPEETT